MIIVNMTFANEKDWVDFFYVANWGLVHLILLFINKLHQKNSNLSTCQPINKHCTTA